MTILFPVQHPAPYPTPLMLLANDQAGIHNLEAMVGHGVRHSETPLNLWFLIA